MHKLITIITMLSFLITTNAFASDPLLLTDAEMQKLKMYFPDSDVSSNHLTWNGNPIAIQLPINQEKRIIFPSHVTADIKGALTTDELRIINNDKSLYITALKPFATTRIFVTLQDSNEVVLIDLVTDAKATSDETYIDIEQNNGIQTLTNTGINNSKNFNNNSQPPIENDTYISLTRFAWQQLFSPERLLNNSLGITRAPMHTSQFVSNLIYGDKVIAHPMASWEYNNTFITAVELRNKYPIPTNISVSNNLCGDWQAVSVYPRTELSSLANSNHHSSDSTILFVISNKPFGDSMEVCKTYA